MKGALTVSDSKVEENQTKNNGNTSEEAIEEVSTESKVITTEEELDAYRIVKAICRKESGYISYSIP